jgi:hypothetical protein
LSPITPAGKQVLLNSSRFNLIDYADLVPELPNDAASKSYVDALNWLQDRELDQGDQLIWCNSFDGEKRHVTFQKYDATGLCGITDADGQLYWVNREDVRKASWLELLALCAGDEDGAFQEEGS